MVRLLQEAMVADAAIEIKFQSHNGAIAADSRCERKRQRFQFQSHNGAIAAQPTRGWRRLGVGRFNPTMVRLLPVNAKPRIRC